MMRKLHGISLEELQEAIKHCDYQWSNHAKERAYERGLNLKEATFKILKSKDISKLHSYFDFKSQGKALRITYENNNGKEVFVDFVENQNPNISQHYIGKTCCYFDPEISKKKRDERPAFEYTYTV
jgi:hypothetical protein